MLVSAFMAAAALAQAVGDATNYAQTALLFVEPYSATLAVVNSADGSIAEVHRTALARRRGPRGGPTRRVGLRALNRWKPTPNGVVVVGSGVDIPMIKPALEAATSLQLSTPEEPEMALARGAALASANAPLFASSTAALAYALDPGTGEVDRGAGWTVPGYQPGYQTEYRGLSACRPMPSQAGTTSPTAPCRTRTPTPTPEWRIKPMPPAWERAAAQADPATGQRVGGDLHQCGCRAGDRPGDKHPADSCLAPQPK